MKLAHAISVAALLLLAACKSGAQTMEEYLQDLRFAEARALLEEKEVGATPSPGAESDALALRERFTEVIDAETEQQVEGLIAAGSTRDAQMTARERCMLCPWSASLEGLVERCDKLVARIETTEQSWSSVFDAEATTAMQARRFLSELAPNRPWILDSKLLLHYESAAVKVVVREWADLITERGGRPTDPECAGMAAELREIGLSEAEMQALEIPLVILARLPPTRYSAEPHVDAIAIEALDEARRLLGKDGRVECTTRLEPCVRAAWDAFSRWYHVDFLQLLESPQVTYREVLAAEPWNTIPNFGAWSRASLGRAHVHLGAQYARQGLASTLALLHVRRARTLGVEKGDPQLIEVAQVARATQASTPTPVYRLEVNLEPKVDPEIHDLVKSAFAFGLQSGEGSVGRLDVHAFEPGLPRVAVTVVDAELVADFSNVGAVSSKYFSHFENVTNPAKSLLEVQLNSARWDMNNKERAYTSAVSTHNIYPTQYSQNNVNWAYTAYSRAVDYYNALVSQYNATPATIAQAVYLPYTFMQGNVRFGWSASARIEVAGSRSMSARGRSVVDDFVRIGSKATDRSEVYRRGDPLDLDISASAGLGHLKDVVAQIREKMNEPLGRVAREPLAGSDPEVQTILGWIYHPWGIQPALADRLGVPAWAASAARGVRLNRLGAQPPVLHLELPTSVQEGPFSPESAGSALSQYVCLVRSGDGVRDLGGGTGTLVGDRGLVLTCAHVLVGPHLRVQFMGGPSKGSYDGELVFVNSERDVALVRARNLRNEGWAALRLAEPIRQGESIVAIGNPGMDIGGTNFGGMSSGIISSPRLEEGGTIFLSADIAIASGSSGGPLFSLKDGALVGVVQMVATSPGFPQSAGQVASTGYLCLAAPANELRAWLGVSYSDG